jgi:hypothetical protein
VFDGQYSFTYIMPRQEGSGQHTVACVQTGEEYDLRVDGESFMHAYQMLKVKKAFTFEQPISANTETQPPLQQQPMTFDFG